MISPATSPARTPSRVDDRSPAHSDKSPVEAEPWRPPHRFRNIQKHYSLGIPRTTRQYGGGGQHGPSVYGDNREERDGGRDGIQEGGRNTAPVGSRSFPRRDRDGFSNSSEDENDNREYYSAGSRGGSGRGNRGGRDSDSGDDRDGYGAAGRRYHTFGGQGGGVGNYGNNYGGNRGIGGTRGMLKHSFAGTASTTSGGSRISGQSDYRSTVNSRGGSDYRNSGRNTGVGRFSSEVEKFRGETIYEDRPSCVSRGSAAGDNISPHTPSPVARTRTSATESPTPAVVRNNRNSAQSNARSSNSSTGNARLTAPLPPGRSSSSAATPPLGTTLRQAQTTEQRDHGRVSTTSNDSDIASGNKKIVEKGSMNKNNKTDVHGDVLFPDTPVSAVKEKDDVSKDRESTENLKDTQSSTRPLRESNLKQPGYASKVTPSKGEKVESQADKQVSVGDEFDATRAETGIATTTQVDEQPSSIVPCSEIFEKNKGWATKVLNPKFVDADQEGEGGEVGAEKVVGDEKVVDKERVSALLGRDSGVAATVEQDVVVEEIGLESSNTEDLLLEDNKASRCCITPCSRRKGGKDEQGSIGKIVGSALRKSKARGSASSSQSSGSSPSSSKAKSARASGVSGLAAVFRMSGNKDSSASISLEVKESGSKIIDEKAVDGAVDAEITDGVDFVGKEETGESKEEFVSTEEIRKELEKSSSISSLKAEDETEAIVEKEKEVVDAQGVLKVEDVDVEVKDKEERKSSAAEKTPVKSVSRTSSQPKPFSDLPEDLTLSKKTSEVHSAPVAIPTPKKEKDATTPAETPSRSSKKDRSRASSRSRRKSGKKSGKSSAVPTPGGRSGGTSSRHSKSDSSSDDSSSSSNESHTPSPSSKAKKLIEDDDDMPLVPDVGQGRISNASPKVRQSPGRGPGSFPVPPARSSRMSDRLAHDGPLARMLSSGTALSSSSRDGVRDRDGDRGPGPLAKSMSRENFPDADAFQPRSQTFTPDARRSAEADFGHSFDSSMGRTPPRDYDYRNAGYGGNRDNDRERDNFVPKSMTMNHASGTSSSSRLAPQNSFVERMAKSFNSRISGKENIPPPGPSTPGLNRDSLNAFNRNSQMNRGSALLQRTPTASSQRSQRMSGYSPGFLPLERGSASATSQLSRASNTHTSSSGKLPRAHDSQHSRHSHGRSSRRGSSGSRGSRGRRRSHSLSPRDGGKVHRKNAVTPDQESKKAAGRSLGTTPDSRCSRDEHSSPRASSSRASNSAKRRLSRHSRSSSNHSDSSGHSSVFDPWEGLPLYEDEIRKSLYEQGFDPAACGIPPRPAEQVRSSRGARADEHLNDVMRLLGENDAHKRRQHAIQTAGTSWQDDDDWGMGSGTSFGYHSGGAVAFGAGGFGGSSGSRGSRGGGSFYGGGGW